MTVCSMTPSKIIKFWKTLLNKRLLIRRRMYYVTNKITEGASVENIRMLQHTHGDKMDGLRCISQKMMSLFHLLGTRDVLQP